MNRIFKALGGPTTQLWKIAGFFDGSLAED
jgi:hypothetical protein